MTALLDEDNLVALCEDCHHKRHKELKRPYNFEETDYYKKIHCAV
jgi:5-methylcytosine-specific restriction endonuclease McrA